MADEPEKDGRQRVSIVVALFNEAAVAPQLVDRLARIAAEHPDRYEVVFVDDGSRDETAELLLKELGRFRHWQLLRLSRNFGLQGAFLAGITAATGDAILCMDGDLQDPPEVIPSLVEAWQRGAKVVIAQRRKRMERGWRRIAIGIFHELFHRFSKGLMPKDSGTFGLIDREVAGHLLKLPERAFFFPGLRCWLGFRQAIVQYDRAEREGGQPKQNFGRLLNYAWDALTSFSDVPLRLIAGAGFILSSLGGLYAMVLVAIRVGQFFGAFKSVEVLGFTTVAVAVFALAGLQLFCLGVVGQYLAKVYVEVKRRPLYIVEWSKASGAHGTETA